MPLVHKFLLVSKHYIEPYDYNTIKRNNGKLIIEAPAIVDYYEINDSLTLYLSDFIKWIPSMNITTNKKTTGLCYHGVTGFLNEDGRMLCSLFSSLTNLFLLAPEKVALTGSYYWYNDDDVKAGKYEKLSFERTNLIDLFEKAASWNALLQQTAIYIICILASNHVSSGVIGAEPLFLYWAAGGI